MNAFNRLLLLIVLYKLGDAFAGSLTTSFLLRGVGFTQTEVGAINKGLVTLRSITTKNISRILAVRQNKIRATFNIENDFTPEEEEQIRRENAWCED